MTQYLNLYKPDIGETGWGEEVNQNFDTIDAKVKYIDNTISNLQTDINNIKIQNQVSYAFEFFLNLLASGSYHLLNAINCTALTTLALTANRVYYMPFLPPRKIKITSIAVYVSTAATSTTKVGIYSDNNYRPYQKLVEVSLDTSSTGLKPASTTIIINSKTRYWFALASTGTPTLRSIAVGGILPILGIVATGTAFTSHYYQSTTGGALPDTANPSTAGTGTIPAIFVTFTLEE